MIVVKNSNLIQIQEGINDIIGFTQNRPLDFKLNYSIKRISDSMRAPMKEFLDARDTIVKNAGGRELTKEEMMNTKTISKFVIDSTFPNYEQYEKEMAILLKEDVELQNAFKIKMSKLQPYSLPISLLFKLEAILEDDIVLEEEQRQNNEENKN